MTGFSTEGGGCASFTIHEFFWFVVQKVNGKGGGMRNIFLKSTWATALSVSVPLSFLVIHISLKQTFNKKRHLLTSLQSKHLELCPLTMINSFDRMLSILAQNVFFFYCFPSKSYHLLVNCSLMEAIVSSEQK